MSCELVASLKNSTFPEMEGEVNTDTVSWINLTWQLSSTQPLARRPFLPPSSYMGEIITRAEVRKLVDEMKTNKTA